MRISGYQKWMDAVIWRMIVQREKKQQGSLGHTGNGNKHLANQDTQNTELRFAFSVWLDTTEFDSNSKGYNLILKWLSMHQKRRDGAMLHTKVQHSMEALVYHHWIGTQIPGNKSCNNVWDSLHLLSWVAALLPPVKLVLVAFPPTPGGNVRIQIGFETPCKLCVHGGYICSSVTLGCIWILKFNFRILTINFYGSKHNHSRETCDASNHIP